MYCLTPTLYPLQILVLAAGSDTIASVSTQEQVALGWTSQGLSCTVSVFDGAKHCQLLVHSPQRYFAKLRHFLANLDVPPD